MKTLLSLFSLLLMSQISFAQELELELELIASGFSSPLEIKHAGDDRLFVVEQGGSIKILNPDGSVNPSPFLNISSIVNSGGERGLLGLAFHPDYTTNGYFYVYYTNTSNNTQISRFSVNTGNPNIADATSELQMLSFTQPFTNHNGGHIAFGPDGKLFIASGDGGSGGDPQNNSQTLTTLLGKILRLDVDLPAPYVPADNPFIDNSAVLDEIWAYGVRNPWKFSFDSVTGDLWIADVGQSALEEINKESGSEGGLNYGWRCYEGNNPFNTNQCPDPSELTFPVAVYNRASGRCSITGGYVYRGTENPAMEGLYFFADLCSNQIGTVNASGDLVFQGVFAASSITSFGVDFNNELYLTAFGGGSVYKIKDNTPLSISESEQDTYFALYPNPARESVTLDFPQKNMQEVAIYDLKGSLLLTENTTKKGTTSISVADFSKGFYVVVLTTETGKKIVKKLIVTN
ncbi:MAG: PQQ-dependent sugar dehydrogenase [Flavobacteriales bacterium]|nr:PQQ-dependent sugar dehydrogenase [Flavobacteriales bacterium]